MKCPNCNYVIASEEAVFCPKCGCPMEVEKVVEVTEESEATGCEIEKKPQAEVIEEVSGEGKPNSIESKLNVLIWIGWGLLATAIIHLISFWDYYSYYKDLFY